MSSAFFLITIYLCNLFMCGIGGILFKSGELANIGNQILERLAHRGPDASGKFTDQQLQLFHTRLSIIDIEGGNQPLFSADGNCVLIANGEIYNHIELRQELTAKGYCFSTHSDCETILHAYAAYGLDCLQHLQGMFAFALYDIAQQRLLLARDRLGIKPLYISQTPLGWAFTSEIKALRPLLQSSLEIDLAALGQYLQGKFSRGRSTLIAGVERILPGEAMCVDLAKEIPSMQRWRYWKANCDAQFESDDFDGAARYFDTLMMQLMEQHLRADVPYGLLLSGGVDSSLLLAMMRQVSTERPRTFSFAFDESGEGSEAAAAKAMAKRFGALHAECRKPASDIPCHLAHMIWATDDLFSDPANVPTSWLAQATAKDVKVVLTGEGGDEVFAGYGRYRRHPLHYFGKGLMDAGCGFHLYGIFNDRAAKEIFNPALYDAARFWRKPLQEEWRNYPRQWSRLQRMQGIDIDGEMANVLLPKVDRMLMSWGVEGRVPFLDHRVVEFGLSLPDSMKISGRNGKVFLKKWGERYLSCDDIWGKKKGFAVPLGKMFNNTFLGKLSGILPRSGAVTALLQPDGVKALVNRQRTQGDVSNQLWRILVLAIWYKLHIEGDSSRPPAKMDLLELLG